MLLPPVQAFASQPLVDKRTRSALRSALRPADRQSRAPAISAGARAHLRDPISERAAARVSLRTRRGAPAQSQRGVGACTLHAPRARLAAHTLPSPLSEAARAVCLSSGGGVATSRALVTAQTMAQAREPREPSMFHTAESTSKRQSPRTKSHLPAASGDCAVHRSFRCSSRGARKYYII